MKNNLLILLTLITTICYSQLPYTWTAGVNPGWTNIGVLNWQGACTIVTTNCAGNYANNLNTFYTSPVMDASCADSVNVTFTACGNAEFGYDFLFLEYSLNSGTTWINPYGAGIGWTGNFGACPTSSTIPIVRMPGSSTFKFRFNFTSDFSIRSSGYKISDFDIWCNSPLPIELTEFTCHSTDKFIELNWITQTETNNDYFVVEKSSNGINWQKIGTITGAGTSTTPISYVLRDHYPPNGINYYRLKQVDYNSDYTYSEITSCDFITIQSDDIYYNVLGQIINFNNCPPGLYFRKSRNNKIEKMYKY